MNEPVKIKTKDLYGYTVIRPVTAELHFPTPTWWQRIKGWFREAVETAEIILLMTLAICCFMFAYAWVAR